MKYYLLLLLSLPISSKGQYYLNSTETHIRNIIKYPINSNYLPDSHRKFIYWIDQDLDNTSISLLFSNSTSLSIQQTIIPLKENINSWVTVFNEKSTKISDTEWKQYGDGRVIRIRLKYLNGFWCFIVDDVTEQNEN